MFFTCPRGIHSSEQTRLYDITEGKSSASCKKCNSFAQYIIDLHGIERLNLIWNDENDISPWDISAHSKKKFIFNCENDDGHVFLQTLDHYTDGIKCPYCSHVKILPKDSLGAKYPEVFSVWSSKNKMTPYEFAPASGKKVWWKCHLSIHQDYERRISSSKNRLFKCPECGNLKSHERNKEDLSGKVFGELTPLYIDWEKTHQTAKTQWVCKCSCGNYTISSVSNLKGGISTTCGNRLIHYSGKNNGNWQGGITPERLKERGSRDYLEWRKMVYQKDSFVCQCCGQYITQGLCAHHIRSFSRYADLRYDINNGISLCKKCHNSSVKGSFHNLYGTINNTPEQLEEYINTKRKQLGIDVPFSIESYLSGNVLRPEIG